MTLENRLDRIETMLAELLALRAVKDWYSTSEASKLLKRAEWTVRQWCLKGRCVAKKIRFGRGGSEEWRISHDELLRIQREGLLPSS